MGSGLCGVREVQAVIAFPAGAFLGPGGACLASVPSRWVG